MRRSPSGAVLRSPAVSTGCGGVPVSTSLHSPPISRPTTAPCCSSPASTFLLGAAPAGDRPEPRAEPGVDDRADVEAPVDPVDDAWPTITRSASRADLVRYAGASGDFNPIHFDHDAAVGAGLAGVVVHGLLMGAWLLQPAAALSVGDRPLAHAKLRFRDPLYAGEAAILTGSIGVSGTDADLRLARATDSSLLVGAKAQLAGG